MIINIEESGMIFPVEEDNTFLIEKSDWINKIKGFDKVEFVEFKQQYNSLRFVEAKTTNPKSSNKDHFDRYIHEIQNKFQNSVSILFSSLSKRKGLDVVFNELPTGIQSVNYKNVECGLWLVVKDSKPEWLIPVLASLKKELKPMLKCWNIPDSNVKVVNEAVARTMKLIR